MRKLEELSYSEFSELIERLDIKADDFILKINKYFPGLTATGELELIQLINDFNETNYEYFQKSYGNLDYYEEGDGEPEKKEYWEITLNILDSMYEVAKSANKKSAKIHHVINSKELVFKDKLDTSGYMLRKALFLKKQPNSVSVKLNQLEDELKKYFDNGTTMLSYIIAYMDKYPKDSNIFFDNFYQRVRILGKDIGLSNPSNKEFYNNLKTFSEQFLI